MKFWKFEFEGKTALETCMREKSLPSPTTEYPGLKNTYAHPLKSMKVGDGLVLASLRGEEGRIFAVGKVRSNRSDTEPSVVDWALTTKTVFPDTKSGLLNWQTKTAFEISPEPAKRYCLKELVEYYVRGDA